MGERGGSGMADVEVEVWEKGKRFGGIVRSGGKWREVGGRGRRAEGVVK